MRKILSGLTMHVHINVYILKSCDYGKR